MKNLINRFAMIAVLGSLVCGILVAGCSSGGDEPETPAAGAPNKTTPEEGS